MDIPYIFLTYSIYIFLEYVPYIPHVCFFIHGLKRRQVLIAKPRLYTTFFQILRLLSFISKFIIFAKSSILLNKFMTFNVRTYCWLNKLRNTQGNIYGTYKEYIRNIKYLWSKIIRHTGALFGGALMGRPHWVCVSDYFIS